MFEWKIFKLFTNKEVLEDENGGGESLPRTPNANG